MLYRRPILQCLEDSQLHILRQVQQFSFMLHTRNVCFYSYPGQTYLRRRCHPSMTHCRRHASSTTRLVLVAIPGKAMARALAIARLKVRILGGVEVELERVRTAESMRAS